MPPHFRDIEMHHASGTSQFLVKRTPSLTDHPPSVCDTHESVYHKNSMLAKFVIFKQNPKPETQFDVVFFYGLEEGTGHPNTRRA